MKPAEKKEKAKKVSFSFFAPHAESVSVAGEFNDWNPASHPMKKDKKGNWKASLNLGPGTYQYRFHVDGEWQNDPDCDECVENPYGTLNCVKKV
ncbi:MAG TPA: isoamylase early set domain-containing protein [Thermodesulfobacteriota bacterium]|nr:isoamylase early set domain-containing protein [Thermodesulfobacteriota bacterium]